MKNDAYIRLLDQDEYLLIPQGKDTPDKRVSVLEATYDECLSYVAMFFHQPEMIRVMYDRCVDGTSLDLSSPERALDSAMDAAGKLAEKSRNYPSAASYAANWLMSKPLLKVLMQRVNQESPAVNSIE